MTHRPVVGFLSQHDPENPDAQSGVPYRAARAIADAVGKVHQYGPARPVIRHPLRLMRQVSRRLMPRYAFHDDHNFMAARARGRIYTERIRATPVDWIFAPYASTDVPFVDTDTPIVYYSDATFRALIDYYPDFANLSAHTKRAGDRLEALTIDKASVCMFSSTWAAASAIEHYGADPQRVVVNELGANIEAPQSSDLRVDLPTDRIQLLFVGVDWARKGGSIASAATRRLRQQGIDAELVVVGCRVPERDRHEGVIEVGFLSRTDPRSRLQFRQLMLGAHLLFVPSQAECYGLIYPEAAAHGLPSIAAHTGGVPSAVIEGRTGHLLAQDARPEQYAAVIADLVTSGDRFTALRRSSRALYEDRFTWEAWGHRLADQTAKLNHS
jgi:glycosyltransferase involved in cell wall biosynthesis